MYRFFIFLGLFPLMLGSCNLPGTVSEGELVENTILFENPNVSMLVPKSWTGVQTDTISPPGKTSIVMAYKTLDSRSGYANNLLVLKDTNERDVSSLRYSELNNVQSSLNYLEYKKVRESDIVFPDNEASKLFVFQARYNESTPRMQFIQTAKNCGNAIYLIHLTLSLDKNPELYIPLLQSFTCKG